MFRTTESNTKFMTAIIHWLSAFPSSTIQYNEPLDHILRPQMIVAILRLLIDESFVVDLDFENYKNLNESLLLQVSDVDEYEAIFNTVKKCFQEMSWPRKRLLKYLGMIKLDDLAVGDYFALTVLCFVFAEIGLHSFKSGIAISTISMLDEDDQEVLKQFMYDEQDLTGRNLVLMQRVNLIEQENAELKKRLQLSKKEIAKLRKSASCPDDEALHELLAKRGGEIETLKGELASFKQLSKNLKSELDQLKDDLSTIDAFQKSPRRSPGKRNDHSPTKGSTIGSKGDNIGLELDVLKWELNLMSEWISGMGSDRFGRGKMV